MDSNDDSQTTQQATQNALDPRRLGKQNSGFSDEDIADIVCLLYPNTENASREVQRIANETEYSPHITGRYTADAIDADLYLEDGAREFGRTRGMGDHAIVLKLSSTAKSPQLGFTFGRNASRCDICFLNDPLRRLSNIHFRIYVNKYGVVMLEDQSTNGTIVDDVLLKKKDSKTGANKRMLESGSTIKIFMHENAQDLTFIVRIPRRDGDLQQAYLRNLRRYLRLFQKEEVSLDRTIGPGPSGHVNLFPPPFQKNGPTGPMDDIIQDNAERLPREWRGGEKYNRVGVIGKGAFATVYKVASKYDGLPYAAKELDKRKFMKNGVLDQKVENEMKIMQAVQHKNIVQYIEHFDWDLHQFIIIMEYVPEGDLGKLVQDHGAIKEPFVKVMARQLIDALGYLHDNKITHRDVKPDNILIESTRPDFVVKLTDFGLSKMIDTEQTFLKTFCGTLLYCAPEVYSEYSTYDEHGRRVRQRAPRATRERYDHAVDVWSLGGVLFYALTGCPPFPVKNGISYTELLHHIMTKPLNTMPLMENEVSNEGIDFLLCMIDRRPETRATIAELQVHPWLSEPEIVNAAKSPDVISDDDGLEQGASQLSLTDRQHGLADGGVSELLEPEPDFSIEYEDDKENYTFNQPQENRLWGEVSAIGSSGAVPEDRLNLPMSTSIFEETKILEPEILDSFESEEMETPKQKRQQPRGLLGSSNSRSRDNSRSVASEFGSQSLGGAESIMENLNMKSLARTESEYLRSRISDVNTSKRVRAAYDTSDEFDGSSGSNPMPFIKRLKSKGGEDALSDDEEQNSLHASVPQIAKSDSGRQIDYPVHKTTFWDGRDKQTWHLDYPEMTHLQYTAFVRAAEKRGEEFSPGKSPLWDLAMKYFPPTQKTNLVSDTITETRQPFLRRDSRSVGENDGWDLPPTAPPPVMDDAESIPDTLPPESQISGPPASSLPKTVVARFTSDPGSVVSGISIPVTDPILAWGRERDNTIRYMHGSESRVPKYAFRILLWKDGYAASTNDFRPWDPPAVGSTTLRASPEPDSFSFYISTKATNGIRINNNPLQPNEPKNNRAPAKYWMKLHHGDTVVVWGTDDVKNQAKLTFECFWGGSTVERQPDEPPTCVSELIARKLDATWTRAEKNLHHDRIKAEAAQDQQCRMKHMAREQERSKVFEQKRVEAIRRLALRTNRQKPSAIIPPVMARAVSRLRQPSPARYVQTND
ncbi:uncharacterized protein BCR38DRAFT_236386 [Pseudomassariella vexata]|uniref:Autophagy-related protein 1 n=1 Tax=Pseudomassariella vexata TaxID=1141098 RepID=A0A1Y2DSY4_9PEZI|nr:uncharacterized protein BCR38DRAFT_236386 [Pseudomassariella vexata]ORY62279.1 hypothetical protein BCR38DRAFT_236386 [Pseudomassariella vexata]